MGARFSRDAFALACLLCVPSFASAQGAAISGTVKDTTGAVLPGATVEASSPALIEKVRTAVTDGSGQYKITELPPGVYTTTVTLTGFSSVKREGIELTSGFTATVNVELKVGSVEETLTVSGQTPIVDVSNSQRQVVMTRDVVNALPTGNNTVEIATLVPGVQLVNGGAASTGMGGSAGMDQFATLSAHGSRSDDTKLEVNGMNVNIFGIREDSTYANFQDGNVQEYAVQVSGQSAESESGGVRVNLIPKEGGNRFTANLFANFANNKLQADNMTDELRATGLRDPDKTKSLWMVNPSVGGPIVKDKVWFYGGFARIVNRRWKAGMYINSTPAAWQPTYNFSEQAVAGEQTKDANIRITWQASPKNKISFYYDENHLCQCPYLIGAQYTGINTPEAAQDAPRTTQLPQFTWTSPVTSRLLIEGQGSFAHFKKGMGHDGNVYAHNDPRVVDPQRPRTTESTTGVTFGAPGVDFTDWNTNNLIQGAVSYVTGTHAFKVGSMYRFSDAHTDNRTFGNVTYSTLNYRPTSVTFSQTPYTSRAKLSHFGLYAQDQWTLRRVTLNLGLRFDYYQQGNPDQHLDPTPFVPTARDYAATTLVKWKDLNPRFGIAYDLFGNGKTAVKGSLSRFNGQQTILNALNPARANTSTTRQWTDPNGDFIIQGDPLNPAINGELGLSSNRNFGTGVISNPLDPDLASGFAVRPYNWEASVSVQHQLLTGLSLNAGYFRRWFGNFQVTQNTLVSPSDYSTYCVTAPNDPRFPSEYAGRQICGLYDLNPNKVGQVNNLTTLARKFGDQYENWNGGDVSLQARLTNGFLMSAGVSTGKTTVDNCDVVTKVNNPTSYNCHVETPFLTQVKFGASYTLPWDIQVSGTLQSFQGPAIVANVTYTNAQIAPTLGRNLSSGTTVNVNVFPGTSSLTSGSAANGAAVYGDRLSQIDLRFAKIFQFGSRRFKGMVDVFNVGNISTVTLVNNTWGTTGSAWQNPTGISLARLVKLGMQIDF